MANSKMITYGFSKYLSERDLFMWKKPTEILRISPILIKDAYKKNKLFYALFGDAAGERSKGLADARRFQTCRGV